MQTLYRHEIESPIGTLVAITHTSGAVCALQFADYPARLLALLARHYSDYILHDAPAPNALSHALRTYFDGQCDALNHITLHLAGSDFQQKVWALLRTIPPGITTTYSALALQLGNLRYARAIGAANSANPIACIVPCHRVLGKDGALTGFAWGLARKRWLLQHESQSSR
jgi:methylated-DNA-[protein]-cysteine S-methyltransferase